MFAPIEAEDGAALVKWAAALAGSDGRVGLQGCSQLGINQLETATLLGPDSPVKAMIPACASGDFYRDTAFDNGIPTIVGSALAGADATSGGDMAYYRDYWKTRDRLARARALKAFTVGPQTSAVAREHGFTIAAESPATDAATFAETIATWYERGVTTWVEAQLRCA